MGRREPFGVEHFPRGGAAPRNSSPYHVACTISPLNAVFTPILAGFDAGGGDAAASSTRGFFISEFG